MQSSRSRLESSAGPDQSRLSCCGRGKGNEVSEGSWWREPGRTCLGPPVGRSQDPQDIPEVRHRGPGGPQEKPLPVVIISNWKDVKG